MCVDDDKLVDAAREVAVKISTGAQTAIRWTKYSLNNWLRAAGPAFDNSLALEILNFTGPDAQEGLDSHREKRKPNFRTDCAI